MKKIILFLILFSINVHAITYSVGTHVPFFNQVQTSTSGGSQVFAINPYLGIGTQFHLAGGNYFMPELGYSYYTDTGSNYNRDTIFLHYNFAYVITNKFIARYGITSHTYRLTGGGGSQTLSNGNGSTRFPSPNKTVSSSFTTLNAGMEYFLSSKNYSIRFDFNIMNSNDLDNRAYNYLLTVNIYR